MCAPPACLPINLTLQDSQLCISRTRAKASEFLSFNKMCSAHNCQVSDFGLSRTILVDNFLQTATKGTITHMPPEVLQDGLLSPSTDVYSFGIMLWEMISGGFPFNAMGQKDIMLAVVGGFRPPMPTFITPNIWALIQQCWDGDYKKRPNFASISRVLQSMESKIVMYSFIFLLECTRGIHLLLRIYSFIRQTLCCDQ